MRYYLFIFLFFLSAVLSARDVGPESNCWYSNTITNDYKSWMTAGNNAQVSKQKICCYSKALSYAAKKDSGGDALSSADIRERRALARTKRGFEHMFYQIDFMGHTWESSGDREDGQMVDENADASIREESMVPKTERWADALADFNYVIDNYQGYENKRDQMMLKSYVADAYFGKGFIAYARGRSDLMQSQEEGDEYHDKAMENFKKADGYLTSCITRDPWCSTAYNIRRLVNREGHLGNSEREKINKKMTDYCRTYDDEEESYSTGLHAYYFDDVHLKGDDNKDTEIRMNSLYHIKTKDRPNDTWSSMPGGRALNVFGVVWKGRIKIPKQGSYTFYLESDDGSRLFIDQQKIIDNWHDHAPKEVASDAQSYQEGQWLNVHVDFYENGGGEVCKLRWEGPGISKSIINYKYLYPPAAQDFAMQPSFWEHDSNDLSGWRFELSAGRSENLTGTFNDNLSGLWIPKYHRVKVYRNTGFGGRNYTIDQGSTSLTNSKYNFTEGGETKSFNDRTSSVIVERTGGFGI